MYDSWDCRHIRARRPLIYGLLFAAMSPLLAQTATGRYEALTIALGFSDLQLSQCQQDQDEPFNKANRILTEGQKSKLRAIVNRLLRSDAEGALVNWLSLNKDVPWGLCVCKCTMEMYAPLLGFSDSQNAKLFELEQAARGGWPNVIRATYEESWNRWLKVLNSGAGKDSPELAQARQGINHLLWGPGEPNKLPREVALGLLNDEQKATVVELEKTLQLVEQAIALGLLPRHMQNSESLCQ